MTEVTITALTANGEAIDKRVMDVEDDYSDIGRHIAHLFSTEADCESISIVRGDDGSAAELDEKLAEN